MSDILLEVGISLASLKTARAQIGAELKSWKFPETEQVQIIDKKQLSDSKKFAIELRKEFEKLGTAIGKGDIKNISEAYAPLEKTAEAASFSSANLRRLAETSKFYNLQASIQGETLSNVRSELSAYNRALADGSVSMQQVGHRYTELGVKFNELSQQQAKLTQGLLAGVNLPRLLLWATGWTLIYSTMRVAQQGIVEIITSIRDLNVAIDEMRIISNETAEEYTKDWEAIRFSIEDAARNGIIAQKKLTEATTIMRFEGTKNKEALAASSYVIKDLMTITRAKDPTEATTALAQSYELFRDKLVGATTESEKMLKIGALLNKMFTDGHITFGEYNSMMSRVGLTAKNVLPNFETLIAFLQLMDAGFKGNRVGGMELAQVLMQLSENTSKLSEVFGITFDPNKLVTPLDVIDEIRKRVGDTIDTSEEYWLKEAGFKDKSLQAFKFILENQEAVNKLIKENVTLNYDVVKGQSERIAQGHPLKKLWSEIVGFFSEAHKDELDFYALAPEALGAREEFRDLMLGTSEEIKDSQDSLKEKTDAITNSTKQLQDAVIEVANEYKKLPFSIEKSIALSEKELNIKKLETLGVNEQILSQERVNAAILKVAFASDDVATREKIINELTSARYDDYEKIFNIITNIIAKDEGIKAANEYINTLVKERASIQLKMYEEIKSLADEIEASTVTFVSNLMSGTASTKDFLQSIVDTYRETFATNIVKIFSEQTGVFASMATAFMSPLQKAHYTGVQSAVPLIVRAHIDGITAGMAGAQSATTATTAQPAGGVSGFLSGISSIFGGGTVTKAPPKAGSAEALKGLPAAGQTTGAQTSKLAKAGAAAGKALGAAAAVYGGIQGITAQKGVGAVKGALGGGLGGLMAGLSVGSIFGPVGTVVGGIIGSIVGAVGGGIMGGKKAKLPEPEIKTQTQEIRSAINLSTKELQLANRNLEGIRRGIEGAYIMPRSAYFSASRSGVSERFSLDSQRGYNG
jgi:hypothetical protein